MQASLKQVLTKDRTVPLAARICQLQQLESWQLKRYSQQDIRLLKQILENVNEAKASTIDIENANKARSSQNIIQLIAPIKMEKLRTLFLGNNHITSIQFISKLQAPKLQQLSLQFNQIVVIRSLRKARFPQLTYLNFDGNPISNLDTISQSNFPTLQEIILEQQSTKHIDMTKLKLFLKIFIYFSNYIQLACRKQVQQDRIGLKDHRLKVCLGSALKMCLQMSLAQIIAILIEKYIYTLFRSFNQPNQIYIQMMTSLCEIDYCVMQKEEVSLINFRNDKAKFTSIPKDKRSEYNQKILEIKQNPNPPARTFDKDYPQSGKLQYQDYKLHYSYIQQTKTPKAVLLYIHGMNGHSAGSGYFASILAQHNPQLNVFAFDQLNFGQSEGPYRGLIQSFEDTIRQVETVVAFLQRQYNKPKIYLSGGSYGGAVAFRIAVKTPQRYAGLILLAPALRNLSEAAPVMKKIGTFIGWLMPKTRLVCQKFTEGTKHNMQDKIMKDQFFYKDKVVPGSVRTVLNAMEEVSQLFSQMRTPYITFQSGVQKMVDTFAGLDLQEASPSTDKTTVFIESMWHAVLAQQQVEEVALHAALWLKQRI